MIMLTRLSLSLQSGSSLLLDGPGLTSSLEASIRGRGGVGAPSAGPGHRPLGTPAPGYLPLAVSSGSILTGSSGISSMGSRELSSVPSSARDIHSRYIIRRLDQQLLFVVTVEIMWFV